MVISLIIIRRVFLKVLLLEQIPFLTPLHLPLLLPPLLPLLPRQLHLLRLRLRPRLHLLPLRLLLLPLLLGPFPPGRPILLLPLLDQPIKQLPLIILALTDLLANLLHPKLNALLLGHGLQPIHMLIRHLLNKRLQPPLLPHLIRGSVPLIIQITRFIAYVFPPQLEVFEGAEVLYL